MFSRPLAILIALAFSALSATASAKITGSHEIDAFKKQFIANGKPRAAINYLLTDYRQKKYSRVSNFARLLIKAKTLTPREKAESYQILALAERRLNRPERERRAWMQFYNLTFSSDALLRVVTLHHLSRQYSEGIRIANRVQLEELSTKGKIKWYRVIGSIYHDSRQLNNARFIRKSLFALQPTAENAFHYSETLQALGDYDEAYTAIQQALDEDPENPDYLLNKATILTATGDTKSATRIINELSINGLIPAKIKTRSAQQLARKGNHDLAKQNFRQALNSIKSNTGEQTLNRHIIDLGQLSIQSELKNLENKFKFGINNTICRDDNGCNSIASLGSTQSAPELGSLYALYQLNKKFAVGGKLLYQHEKNGVGLDTDTGVGSIGLNIKPMRKNNLQISLERQFGIGDLTRDNTRLMLSYQHSRGDEIKPSATNEKSWPYLHIYAEVSKLFEQEKDSLAFLEGRYGRTIKLNQNTALSPYFFGQGSHLSNDLNSNQHSTEAGLGVSLNIDQMIDPYKGARGHTEIFFKAGRDLVVTEDDEEFRTRMGIEFNYQ